MDAGQQARRVLYSGRVQGVGFRYTARQIAGRYNVTGFVRNLSDGRVELVAEGPAGELEGLLADIAQTMVDYIGEMQVEKRSATGEYAAFEIAR